jgi:hypothetical protein
LRCWGAKKPSYPLEKLAISAARFRRLNYSRIYHPILIGKGVENHYDAIRLCNLLKGDNAPSIHGMENVLLFITPP